MNKIIGTRIKEIRQDRGISRDDLSKELDISIHTLSKYEQCQREPNSEMIRKIAEALDVVPGDLLYSKEESKKKTDKLIENLYVTFSNKSKEENHAWNEKLKELNKNLKIESVSELGNYIGKLSEKFVDRINAKGIDCIIFLAEYASLENKLKELNPISEEELSDILRDLSSFLEYKLYKISNKRKELDNNKDASK